MVWLLQFGQLVVLSVKYVWYGCYNLGQLVVLSVNMCGMAVTIWSTCGFERNMCGMAVTIWSTCGFERKYVWYGCYNLVNLWF